MLTPCLRGFLLVLALLGLGLAGTATAQDAAAKARIEALIRHVEGLGDATFIRNGRNYPAKDAAKFLRGKWSAKADRIRSAEDFIREAATTSGTTGQPYRIRFKDGREIPCGAYLGETLKTLP